MTCRAPYLLTDVLRMMETLAVVRNEASTRSLASETGVRKESKTKILVHVMLLQEVAEIAAVAVEAVEVEPWGF